MEHFGTIRHFHKGDEHWRTWHVYADFDEFGNIDFIYVQFGAYGVLSNGIAPRKCQSPLLKHALAHVQEALADIDDGDIVLIDEGDIHVT